MQFVTFAQVGLPVDSNDRVVWRFAQDNGMILLTGNRRMTGQDSLERTIREENQTTSLPVLTIGNLDRLVQRTYRERCANRLADIVFDLGDHLALLTFIVSFLVVATGTIYSTWRSATAAPALVLR